MSEVVERKTLYGFPAREPDLRRSSNRKTFDIKKLWDRQHEILNLNALGYKGTVIAKMLDITPACVSNTLNSTLGEKVKSEIRKTRDEKYEELQTEVTELTEKALKVYHEIFDEPDESGRVPLKMKKEAADTVVLELSGLRAATKIDSRHIGIQMSPEDIESFKRRGIEAARVSGKIIEVEGEGTRNQDN